jgi:hypothetical protein
MLRQQLFVFVIEHDGVHADIATEIQKTIATNPHVSQVGVLVKGDHSETVVRTLNGVTHPLLTPGQLNAEPELHPLSENKQRAIASLWVNQWFATGHDLIAPTDDNLRDFIRLTGTRNPHLTPGKPIRQAVDLIPYIRKGILQQQQDAMTKRK